MDVLAEFKLTANRQKRFYKINDALSKPRNVHLIIGGHQVEQYFVCERKILLLELW